MSELTAAFLPVYHNPYQHLLKEGLSTHGIAVQYLDNMPSPRWLWRSREKVHILHLHWLYGLYMQRYLTPFRLAAFCTRLYLARRLGYGLVWTAHNLLPHRRFFPPMHRFVRRLVMNSADAVIVHCEYGRDELHRLFPRQKPIHVIPHGNYEGVHPITMTRSAAREQLNIPPDAFVYGQLGNITSYKGTRRFVQQFRQIAAERDVALIAGRNRDSQLVSELKESATTDPRLHLHAGFIPEEEMQHYLLATDAMVFTFREVLTSGSVILALTYGVPVIAPAAGCLPELVTEEAGLLYRPDDDEALARAMTAIRKQNLAKMREQARAIAHKLDWAPIARKTAALYRTILEQQP
ncbi:MAG: glycosyltransferase family 4 protein [Candidatus Promineifilaceae bacterium]|nr:glycosyltransferase family 4 protein [Candidatus Promineifilaceae bacterium]